MTAFDPLWVPILTHYRENAPQRLDRPRTEDHIRRLTPFVRQYLVAGTTGDGWEMTDQLLGEWIALLQETEVVSRDHSILFGAFGDTTEAVIRRTRLIEGALEGTPLKATYAGLTVCAPVSAEASQEDIFDHFSRIIEATHSPIAVYQLPQVVKCEIAPETLERLTQTTNRIVLFKDTSGADKVANSLCDFGDMRLLRGAEGDYATQVKPNGPYDGWLLSTANGLARELRSVADAVAGGAFGEAEEASRRLTALVEDLFAAAADLPDGNPFSNANRAVDHVFAHGPRWRKASSVLASGQHLPEEFLARVEALLSEADFEPGDGYRSKFA